MAYILRNPAFANLTLHAAHTLQNPDFSVFPLHVACPLKNPFLCGFYIARSLHILNSYFYRLCITCAAQLTISCFHCLVLHVACILQNILPLLIYWTSFSLCRSLLTIRWLKADDFACWSHIQIPSSVNFKLRFVCMLQCGSHLVENLSSTTLSVAHIVQKSFPLWIEFFP